LFIRPQRNFELITQVSSNGLKAWKLRQVGTDGFDPL
jgi:hypothetical protein